MRILINCSNLKKGGGLQVADSVCRQLYRYPNYIFVVVLSSNLQYLENEISQFPNVITIKYDIRNSILSILGLSNSSLDKIVSDYSVDCVLTLFGPSRWKPKVPHLSGFARPHIVLKGSPFFQKLNFKNKILLGIRLKIIEFSFIISSNYFYTENPYITKLLRQRWKKKRIYTITNYYNQIFDQEEKWKSLDIPPYQGYNILTISAYYPHKNLEITIKVAEILKNKFRFDKFRFILTIKPNEINVPDSLKEHFYFLGKVTIDSCPMLYRLADVSFQPSLMECFSATFVESMKMNVPIVTTDLPFARGLCGDAAQYYESCNAEHAASSLYNVINNKGLRTKLQKNGIKQLSKFDDYDQRSDKLIRLCEEIINS